MLHSEINFSYLKQWVHLPFEKCNTYWCSRSCQVGETTLHTLIWSRNVIRDNDDIDQILHIEQLEILCIMILPEKYNANWCSRSCQVGETTLHTLIWSRNVIRDNDDIDQILHIEQLETLCIMILPESQHTTDYTGIIIIPLVITHSTPLFLVEDFNTTSWTTIASSKPYKYQVCK